MPLNLSVCFIFCFSTKTRKIRPDDGEEENFIESLPVTQILLKKYKYKSASCDNSEVGFSYNKRDVVVIKRSLWWSAGGGVQFLHDITASWTASLIGEKVIAP